MTFNQLSVGAMFVLTPYSTRVLTKVEPFWYEDTRGNVFREENNCKVYTPPTPQELNQKRLNNRNRYEVMKSTGMRRTKYGWE